MKKMLIDPIDALKPCVATIGFFDGMHPGHAHLIAQVKEVAAQKGLASAVITFPVHPRRVLHADDVPELLSTYPEKVERLAKTGIDYCFTLNFTPAIASLSAYDFMATILRDRFRVAVLLIGYDHRFGRDRAEGFDDYCRYGTRLGIEVIQAEAFTATEERITISSSLIRKRLKAGDVAATNLLLGYEYGIEGTVVSGHQVGRAIGFPTANMALPGHEKLLPADGVYAVRVLIDGVTYAGMMNIGHRPTIGNGHNRTCEVHLLRFTGNLYGKTARVWFVQRIRNEVKFADKEALTRQLAADARAVEKLLL